MTQVFNQLCTTRCGRMLVNRHDVYIGRSLQVYGEYSFEEILLLEHVITAGDVVVEVGANIGAHTVPLAQRLGQRGRLLAFEPQRLVFQLLCANLALNQCSQVEARQQAVGASAGQITVPLLPADQNANFGGVELGGQTGESVGLVALGDLSLTRCHLLKLDVEGMEREVLLGASDTIARLQPVLYLENDRRERSPALLDHLFNLGYHCWWHLPPLFRPDNFHGQTEDIFHIVSLNLVALPKGRKLPVEGLQAVRSTEDWPLPDQ